MGISVEARVELGARLNALRAGAGLTPETVAAGLLGHIESIDDVVGRMERGATSRLERETLEKLAALFHVDLDALLPAGVSLDDFEGPDTAPPAFAELPARGALERSSARLRHKPGALPVSEQATVGTYPTSVTEQASGEVPSTQARIRQLRQAAGLSASAFAMKLSTKDVPILERDIGDWERARRRPTRDQLDAIALFAGVTPNWVMTGRVR
jgi:DNA-binding transcriptional regulator YiaG